MAGGNGGAAIEARIPTLTSSKLKFRQLVKLSGMPGHDISLARQELTKLTFIPDQAKPAFDLLKASYLTDGVLIKIINPSFNIRIRQSNLRLLAEGYQLDKLEEAKDILSVMKETDSPVKDMAAQAYAKLFEAPQAEPIQPKPNQDLEDQQKSLIEAVKNINDSLDGLFAQAAEIRKIFAGVDAFGKTGQDEIEAQRGKISEDIEELEAQKDISSVMSLIYGLESDNRKLEVDAVELKADTDTVSVMALRMEELLDYLAASLKIIREAIKDDKEVALDAIPEADIDEIVRDDIKALSQPAENALITATATAEILPQVTKLWMQYLATGKDLMKGINKAADIAKKHAAEHSAEVKALMAQQNLYEQQIAGYKLGFKHALKGAISKIAEIKTALEAEVEEPAQQQAPQQPAASSAPGPGKAQELAKKDPKDNPFFKTFKAIGMRIEMTSFDQMPGLIKEMVDFIRGKWPADFVPIAEAFERMLELKESGQIKDKGDYASQVRIEMAETLGQMAAGVNPIISLEDAEHAVTMLTESLKLVDESSQTMTPPDPTKIDWLKVAQLISNGASTVGHDAQVAEMARVRAQMEFVVEQIKGQFPEVAKQIEYTLEAVKTPANIGAFKSALRKRIIGALEKIVVNNPEAEAVLVVLNQHAIGPRTSFTPPPPPPGAEAEKAPETPAGQTSAGQLRDIILTGDGNLPDLIVTVKIAIDLAAEFSDEQKEELKKAVEGITTDRQAVYDALHMALVKMTEPVDAPDAVVNFSLQFLPEDTF